MDNNNNSNDERKGSKVIRIHQLDEADPPLWTLIEVNGEILPPKELSKDDNTIECELGSIWFEADSNVPILTIGSHELRGTVEPLSQAFCILEQSDNDGYQVCGMIDRKLLFNRYPKTLMR